MVRNLSKAAENDENFRGDDSRHLAASWLAHGGRGSPKARKRRRLVQEVWRRSFQGRQFLNAMAFQSRRWLAGSTASTMPGTVVLH